MFQIKIYESSPGAASDDNLSFQSVNKDVDDIRDFLDSSSSDEDNEN